MVDGGGVLCGLESAEGLVWADAGAALELPAALAQGAKIRWVGLPFAGIEPYLEFLDHERSWTAAKGVYAKPVAEHALALGLAGMRGLVRYSRTQQWSGPQGRNLLGANVTILGAGGITKELLKLLEPFGCHTTVVRRSGKALPGAARTVTFDERLGALADADLVVLALALTPETRHVIARRELEAMPEHCWLVNVARGGHINQDDLLAELDRGGIAGASLDVTDPEPLPASDALWHRDNVLITPHIGNTPAMGAPLLADHVKENVALFIANKPLRGLIDVTAGY